MQGGSNGSSVKAWPRVAGLFTSLFLALLAQSLLTGSPFPLARGEQAVGLASLLILLSAVLAALASLGTVLPSPEPPVLSWSPAAVAAGDRRHRVALVVGVVAWAGSVALYAWRGDTLAPQLLWPAGVLGLLYGLSAGLRNGTPAAERTWLSRGEWPLVGALTLVAFAFRYYRLTQLPNDLDGDFATAGLQVLGLWKEPVFRLIAIGDARYPFAHYESFGLAMRLFGKNLFGLMMHSVITGTLTVPAVYLAGREMFGRRVALIAAALLTASYTHFHFSRVILTASTTLTVTLLVFFLFRAIRTGHPFWFALAGASGSAAFMQYHAGRIGPATAILVFLWLVLFRFRDTKKQLWRWLLVPAGALAVLGPMAVFYARNIPDLIGRGAEINITGEGVQKHLMYKYHASTLGQVFLEQIKRSFLTFHFYGDSSSEFGFPGPMVDTLTAALLVVGLGIAFRFVLHARPLALVFCVIGTLFFGGTIMLDPPDWVHLVIAIPPACVLAGLAADRLFAALEAPLGRLATAVAGAILLAALVWTAKSNWSRYVSAVGDNSNPRVSIARYIDALPNDTEVVIVIDPYQWWEREFEFFNRGVKGRGLSEEDIRQGATFTRPATLILSVNHEAFLAFLKERYPEGVVETHRYHGWVHFHTFRLPAKGRPEAPPYGLMGETDTRGWLAGVALCLLVALGGLAGRQRGPAAREG